jgi:ribose 5-phosphate isomerase B
MRLGIATDHGGFGLKEELIARIRAAGHEVVYFGAQSLNREDDDSPDYVVPLGQAVVAGKVDRCVAICASGLGASVCANKVNSVRACLIHDHFSAKQGVEDDHTNDPLHGRTNRWPGSRLGSRPNLSGHRIPQRGTSSSLGQARRA